jgi:hypothetical protein
MREDGTQISSLETDRPPGMFFIVVWKRNRLEDYQWETSSRERTLEIEMMQEYYL